MNLESVDIEGYVHHFSVNEFLMGRGNSVKGWNVLSRMAWMNGKVNEATCTQALLKLKTAFSSI